MTHYRDRAGAPERPAPTAKAPQYMQHLACKDVAAELRANYDQSDLTVYVTYWGNDTFEVQAEKTGRTWEDIYKSIARAFGIRSSHPLTAAETERYVKAVLKRMYNDALYTRLLAREQILSAAGVPEHARNGY